jgi:aminopeptidase N
VAGHLVHEGFATWSEWIWSEHTGNKTAQKYFDNLYNTPAQDTIFWTPPPGDPGSPVFLFNGTIYYRGAMTLQALRQKIGEFAFFSILRRWATENRYGNVTTAVHRAVRASLRNGAQQLLRRLALPAREADGRYI